MIRVGLTGGIASGKSLVSEVLGELGAFIIDSDVLAREVVQPDSPGLSAVVRRFTSDVLDRTGALDRKALADIVFSDAQARSDLNAIIHPLVIARAAELVALAPSPVVVQVIPLLVETAQQDRFDELIVVDVPRSVQLDRLCIRDGLAVTDASQRIAAQARREERLEVASRIIDNSGAPSRTRAAAALLWSELSLLAERQGR